ncbi:hypothetical protein RB594_007412 [Gaeumannomyces avenae]
MPAATPGPPRQCTQGLAAHRVASKLAPRLASTSVASSSCVVLLMGAGHERRREPLHAPVLVHDEGHVGVADGQPPGVDARVRDPVERDLARPVPHAAAPDRPPPVVPVVEARDPAPDVVRGIPADAELGGRHHVVPELDRLGRVGLLKGAHKAAQDRTQPLAVRRRLGAKVGQAVQLGQQRLPVGALAEQRDRRQAADDVALELEVGLREAHHQHVGRHAVGGRRGREVGRDPVAEPGRPDPRLDLVLEPDQHVGPRAAGLHEHHLLPLVRHEQVPDGLGVRVHEEVHLRQDREPHLVRPHHEVQVLAPRLDGAPHEAVRRRPVAAAAATAVRRRRPEGGLVVRRQDDVGRHVVEVVLRAHPEVLVPAQHHARPPVRLGLAAGEHRDAGRDSRRVQPEGRQASERAALHAGERSL